LQRLKRKQLSFLLPVVFLLDSVYGYDILYMEAGNMTILEAFEQVCKASGKYGLYLSTGVDHDAYPDSGVSEVQRATLLPTDDAFELATSGQSIFLFDTMAECLAVYCNVVGDEGPTKTNPYNGPVKVFAYWLSPDGRTGSENT
jgi:hypothetical protein